MRKISFIMAALALVLGVTQCKKEDKPVASGETQRIVLTASNGNNGSKVVVNETPKMLNLTWQDTDKIAASGAVEGTLAYKSDVEPGTATFEGSVTRKEGETVTFSIGSAPESFEDQTGDVTWIQNHLYLVGTADYNEEGVYGQDEKVEMKLQYAVLKLDLSAFGTDTDEGTTVTISNASGTVATVTNVTKANKVYYVAMPAAASTTYTFSGVQGSVEKTWPLAANIFYTKNENGDAILVGPAPAISGDFIFDVVDYFGEEYLYDIYIENIDWGAESGNVFIRIDDDDSKIIEVAKDYSAITFQSELWGNDGACLNMIKNGSKAQLWLETIYGSRMVMEKLIVHATW